MSRLQYRLQCCDCAARWSAVSTAGLFVSLPSRERKWRTYVLSFTLSHASTKLGLKWSRETRLILSLLERVRREMLVSNCVTLGRRCWLRWENYLLKGRELADGNGSVVYLAAAAAAVFMPSSGLIEFWCLFRITGVKVRRAHEFQPPCLNYLIGRVNLIILDDIRLVIPFILYKYVFRNLWNLVTV